MSTDAAPAGPEPTRAPPAAPSWLAVLLGIAVTLCVRGYRYGESNHAVYLVDALRRLDPTLLANDWWTTHTLQYHFVFNALSGWLMKLGIIEPVFLIGYLALALLLHVAWYRLVRAVGGDGGAYGLSVVLFYVLGAGLGLGSYHFLQDRSFLPSNVSNVAMLWGILHWTQGRWRSAGLALGIAGLFHINHAVMVIGLWTALSLIEWRRHSVRGLGASTKSSEGGKNLGEAPKPRTGDPRRWLVGTFALLSLSLPAIAPAAKTVLTRSHSIPLHEFVDLFVHLRHPHHFDPMTWHWALWLIFLLPIPLAIAYARQTRSPAVARASGVFLVISGVTVVALLGAGVWFVSETLVQFNLYRFSIYLKLLACIGAGSWLSKAGLLTTRGTAVVVTLLVAVMVGVIFAARTMHGDGAMLVQRNAPGVLLALAWAAAGVVTVSVRRVVRAEAVGVAALAVVVVAYTWPRLGLSIDAVSGDPPAYVELARWARDNTPKDAVFLVPPEEQSFRLHARRAIVVNYKNVPQLSAELPEWRDRLEAVMDLPDLMTLPKGMGKTLAAIAERYAALPPAHLAQIARHYGAAYVVTTGPYAPPEGSGLRFAHQAGPFGLYSVDR